MLPISEARACLPPPPTSRQGQLSVNRPVTIATMMIEYTTPICVGMSRMELPGFAHAARFGNPNSAYTTTVGPVTAPTSAMPTHGCLRPL